MPWENLSAEIESEFAELSGSERYALELSKRLLRPYVYRAPTPQRRRYARFYARAWRAAHPEFKVRAKEWYTKWYEKKGRVHVKRRNAIISFVCALTGLPWRTVTKTKPTNRAKAREYERRKAMEEKTRKRNERITTLGEAAYHLDTAMRILSTLKGCDDLMVRVNTIRSEINDIAREEGNRDTNS